MAETKASIRRKERQEELREKLQGLEYLRQIDDAVKVVISSGYQVESDELQARKFVVDTNFKRLAKVLPDLKSLEHDVGDNLKELIIKDLSGAD